MTNVRTIHVDWYNQRTPSFKGGPQLAYQGDHLSNMVVFDNAPELPNYYLLVEMKTDDEGPVVVLPGIQLEGPQWVIPNYYTQICQQITYQVCCKTGSGDYEHHSAKFHGTILPVLKHNGKPIDQSPMFDPYIDILDKRVDELIVASGDIQIDSELKSDSGNPVQNRVVKAAIDGLEDDVDAVNGRLHWYPLAVNVTDGSYVVGSTGGIDTNANLSYAEVSVLAFRGKGITIQSYLWEGAGYAFLDADGHYITGESANTKGITPEAGVLTKVETSVPYNAYSLRVTLHQQTYAANTNRYFFTIGESKATKVVFIGDSYGTGYNTGGATTGWIPGTAAALGLKSSDFESHAKGGAGFRHPANITPFETFTDLLNLSTLAKAEVGKIVVCGGYNEQLYTVSQLLEAFGTFAAKARTMYPFAEICIGMIGHSGTANEQETLMNTVRQAYMQMANRAGVRYLSNVEYVLTDDNVSSDGVHPDQTGADNLATAIGNAVKTGSASGKSYQSEITELDGRLHELGNSVDNAIAYINEGQATPTFTLFDGYIKKTGALQETDTSKATDFIPIYGNIAKRIEHTFTRSLSGVGYAFYDENKTYITDSWSNDYGNGVISVIPDTARYFRITQNPVSVETKTVTIIYNDNNETIERIERKVDSVPTFHRQEYVPHPAESELYDFIVVPEGAEEICMKEFDSLDSGNFRITLSGSASAVASDGYLVFTTVNGETGLAIAEYAELVDTSKNTRYSLLFNYVTANTSQLRVFDIGKGKFYLFLNRTNKLRIVVLDTEGAVKYIDQSGAVVDSSYDFNISVNTEYILEVIIADGKIKAKMYNPTDDSVILDTETPLSELSSLDGGLVRFGKIATTASTAVNYKVGWFQHDVTEG